MNDAEYRATKKRLRTAIGKWAPVLGLLTWRMTYEYDRESTEGGQTNDGVHYAVAGTCSAKWQYLEAHATFNMPQVQQMSDDYLERLVVHELLHAVVNEMREDGLDHEERVVSHLTRSFFWAEAHSFGKPISDKDDSA